MKPNNQNSKVFELNENFKRELTPIIIIIFILISLLSCSAKPGITKPSKQLKSQIGQDNSMESHRKSPIDLRAKNTFFVQNKKAWFELKELMGNNLMSIRKLGIIDCSGYDRNSVKLRFIQDVTYNILNQPYRWFTYQAKDGLCIESLTFDRGVQKSYLLSLEDSRVLLSAAKGFHFNELGLKSPKILSKRTIFWNINGTPCGGSQTVFYKDRSITTSKCEEYISYKYDD